MEKVRPWCGQPSDRGRLKNRTEQNRTELAGRSGLVVSSSNCGVRGPRFESRRGRLCLSRQPLRYAASGTGCAPVMQCLGRLSLPPFCFSFFGYILAWTYFLRLFLSSVILFDSSAEVLSTRPCMVFLACVYQALFLVLSL